MSEPLRGRALALEALRRIEARPEEWQQDDWHCGAACCFAGHVVLAAGYEWVEDDLYPAQPGRGTVWVQPRDKSLAPEVAGRAAAMLLDIPEPDELPEYDENGVEIPHPFDASNTLDDLKRLVDEYLPLESAS